MVKLIQTLATVKQSFNVGDTYPCEPDEGARLIEAGFADEESADEPVKIALAALRKSKEDAATAAEEQSKADAEQAAKDKEARAAKAKAIAEKQKSDAKTAVKPGGKKATPKAENPSPAPKTEGE